jgi:D-alanine transaminase
MTTIAYWNETCSLLSELRIPVLDRAYFFGDAVYEVIPVYDGKPFLLLEHLERLKRSSLALNINTSYDFYTKILKNISENKINKGIVYIQVSRGSALRVHSFYGLDLSPNILIYSKEEDSAQAPDFNSAIKAITCTDLRWARCDIKSTNLLANTMAISEAYQKGAKEAILVRSGMGVTECASANIFMVKNGSYITPPLSHFILPGITRARLLSTLKKRGLPYEERAIEKSELYQADELFLTSSTREALGIGVLDDQIIGNGSVGIFTKNARKLILLGE